MIEVVWEFEVAEEHREQFESLYNSEGVWVELFRLDNNYAGTTLLRDRERQSRYLTIDRWNSLESYKSFKARYAAQYKEIDERCEALTANERLIGIFDRV